MFVLLRPHQWVRGRWPWGYGSVLSIIIIYLVQFSHADSLDMVMVVGAVLFSILSGFGIPTEAVLIGQLINTFISCNAAQDITDSFVNFSIENCTQSRVQELLNSGSGNNSDRIFCDAFERGNVINSASMFVCDPIETLTEETHAHSLYFVYLAVGVFVTHILAYVLWSVSASRQSRRLRIAFYRAIMKHDIAWFETNDVSQLGHRFLK